MNIHYHFHQHDTGLLTAKKTKIEAVLAAKQSLYPEWVYEVGFNPGLRSGFRFFLVNLERVIEIFFSMNYLANSGIDTTLLKSFAKYLTDVIEKNNELIHVLINYFSENKLKDTKSESDFTSDMTRIRKSTQSIDSGQFRLAGYVFRLYCIDRPRP